MVTTFGCRTRASNRPSWMIADARREAMGEFQRDLAVEPRIPGPVDLSERAPADPLDEPKMTPHHRRVRTLRLHAERRDLRARRWSWRGTAMEICNGCQHPQLSNEQLRCPIRARFGSRPVDRGAVEDGVGEIVNQPLTRRHGSSPRPARRGPGAASCAPRLASACPARADHRRGPARSNGRLIQGRLNERCPARNGRRHPGSRTLVRS